MKTKISAFVSLIGIVLLYPVAGSSQNLVQNGDFETATYAGWPYGNMLPPYPIFTDHWAAVNVDGELMYSDTLAHTGTGFLSVLQNTASNPAVDWLGNSGAGGYDRAIQLIPVTPSTTYQLQFFLRSGNSLRYGGYGSGTAFIQVEQFSPSYAVIDTFMQYTPLTWQQFNYSFTTGATCTDIALLFSVTDPAAADAWFDDVILTSGKPTGLNEAEAQEKFTIFPTLFSDRLYSKNNSREEALITIYDALLMKVAEEKFTGSLSISTQDFPCGIYFYEIRNAGSADGQTIKKGKLVKQ